MLISLAQVTLHVFSATGLMAALVLTVIGMSLHWYQPNHRMGLEERVKDGKITAEEARRQILFYTRFAPVATLLGVILLTVVLVDVMS